jgi:hypothetical protein
MRWRRGVTRLERMPEAAGDVGRAEAGRSRHGCGSGQAGSGDREGLSDRRPAEGRLGPRKASGEGLLSVEV